MDNSNAKYTQEDVLEIVKPIQASLNILDKHMGNNNNTLLEYLEVIRIQTREITKNNLLRVMQDSTFSNEERKAARQEYEMIVTSEREKQTLPSHSL